MFTKLFAHTVLRSSLFMIAGCFVFLSTTIDVNALTCGVDTVSRDGYTYGTVVAEDGRCWLDRNLGASRVATAYNDSSAYGWLFQWGRGVDGHQNRASGVTGSNSSSDTPGHANYILESSSPYDWRAPQNANLWQGVDGVNNPCPTGFRLPTSSEWYFLRDSAGITNYSTAFASLLKMTVGGWRLSNDGVVKDVGIRGIYWTDTPNGSYSYDLHIHSTGALVGSFVRARGASVRCIKEQLDPPTLTTSTTTNIAERSATGNGNISDIGTDNPERFIEWGTVSGTYTDECSAGTGATGDYSCNLTNLTPNTTYYYRAKATNSVDTSYGDELSFTTLPLQDQNIPDPQPSDLQNAVTNEYMTVTGTASNTTNATTHVNITFTSNNAQALFPTNTVKA
jgi:uncharacterized protein (TIGR02145 family)